jgi:hypothetical protein
MNLYLFIGTRNFHYCENYEPQKTIFFIFCTESKRKYVCRVHHQLSQYLFIGEFGVFNILKITTTTHNDIVCISFNSKSAHSAPPIYINMQKEDSLSFLMVVGSGGRGLSLLNKICIGAKWLRLWFLWSFNVIWKLRLIWYEIDVCNNSYLFFYVSKNYLMLWQAMISWSFYCDEMWFTEVNCYSP